MHNLFEKDDEGNIIATSPIDRELQKKHMMVRPSLVKGRAIVNGKYKDIKELSPDERIALKDEEARQLERKRQEDVKKLLKIKYF